MYCLANTWAEFPLEAKEAVCTKKENRCKTWLQWCCFQCIYTESIIFYRQLCKSSVTFSSVQFYVYETIIFSFCLFSMCFSHTKECSHCCCQPCTPEHCQAGRRCSCCDRWVDAGGSLLCSHCPLGPEELPVPLLDEEADCCVAQQQAQLS